MAGLCIAGGMHAREGIHDRGHAWRGPCVLGACVAGGGHVYHALPPVDRMTDACKNITFPQTTYADGNKNKQDDPILNCCVHKTFYFQIHLHTQFDNYLREKIIFSEHAHPMGLSVILENGTV